jgi:hypothetical protein
MTYLPRSFHSNFALPVSPLVAPSNVSKSASCLSSSANQTHLSCPRPFCKVSAFIQMLRRVSRTVIGIRIAILPTVLIQEITLFRDTLTVLEGIVFPPIVFSGVVAPQTGSFLPSKLARRPMMAQMHTAEPITPPTSHKYQASIRESLLLVVPEHRD